MVEQENVNPNPQNQLNSNLDHLTDDNLLQILSDIEQQNAQPVPLANKDTNPVEPQGNTINVYSVSNVKKMRDRSSNVFP